MEETAGDEEEEVEEEVEEEIGSVVGVGKLPVVASTFDRECCCVVDETEAES